MNVLSVFRETSMAGITALLSSLLLQASNGHDPAGIDSSSLPRNFLSTAHAVLYIINNVFLLSLQQTQELVTAADLRTELLYCVSFLVAFCSAKWDGGRDCEVLLRAFWSHEPWQLCRLLGRASSLALCREATVVVALVWCFCLSLILLSCFSFCGFHK
jgi:hypothetical protein